VNECKPLAAGGVGGIMGYQGPHGGDNGPVMFGQKKAPLASRVNPFDNQVDPRGRGLHSSTFQLILSRF